MLFDPLDFGLFVRFLPLADVVLSKDLLVCFDISLQACHLLPDLFVLDVELLEALLTLVFLGFEPLSLHFVHLEFS